jgi:hypothetical protein
LGRYPLDIPSGQFEYSGFCVEHKSKFLHLKKEREKIEQICRSLRTINNLTLMIVDLDPIQHCNDKLIERPATMISHIVGELMFMASGFLHLLTQFCEIMAA